MNPSEAKHAFITGGASGIGLGVAEALADLGVAVTLADIDEDALAAAAAKRPRHFFAQALDTRDRTAWAAAKARAEAKFGPVDILMNNAGIAPNQSEFADMDADSFDRIIAINLTGVFNGVSAFAADLRARKRGHIVNTSSMAGLYGGAAKMGAYAAAKFGVVALSETLRVEMAPHGVGVSVLCPGLVKTNLGASTAKLTGKPLPTMEMPASEVSTADVARAVLSAITENKPYIITHKQYWSKVAERVDALQEAFK